MNNLESIMTSMIDCTITVLHSKFSHLKGFENFTCKSGKGEATYLETKRHLNQPNNRYFKLVYGIKMLSSKQTKKDALRWTTGKEIIKRGYYDGDPSFKDFICAVILHEYAHLIQSLKEGRKFNSVHNEIFYNILDLFYKNNYHKEVDAYLSSNPDYEKATYIDGESEYLKKTDLIGAAFVVTEQEGGRAKIYSVKKLNNRTLNVVNIENKTKSKIYYESIVEFYYDEKNLIESKYYTKKTKAMIEKKDFNHASFLSNKFRFVDVNIDGNLSRLKIKHYNETELSAVSLNLKSHYRLKFQDILAAY